MKTQFIHEKYQHCIQPFLESVFNTMGEAVVVSNNDGIIIMVNQHVKEVWGYPPQTLIGKDLVMLMPEKFRAAHKAGMERYNNTGEQKVLEQRLELEGEHANGTIFPIQLYISETIIDNERCFTAAIRDVTSIVQQRIELEKTKRLLELNNEVVELKNAKLMQEVQLDPMTRLFNHNAFIVRLQEELNRLSRVDSSLALLFIDIDNFKHINDEYGHLYGDECLQKVADMLLSMTRRSADVAGRLGGDEYALLMPNTSLQGALHMANTIQSAVKSATWSKQALTITIGISCTFKEMSHGDFIEQADQALYHGKFNGKNQIVNYQQVANYSQK